MINMNNEVALKLTYSFTNMSFLMEKSSMLRPQKKVRINVIILVYKY